MLTCPQLAHTEQSSTSTHPAPAPARLPPPAPTLPPPAPVAPAHPPPASRPPPAPTRLPPPAPIRQPPGPPPASHPVPVPAPYAPTHPSILRSTTRPMNVMGTPISQVPITKESVSIPCSGVENHPPGTTIQRRVSHRQKPQPPMFPASEPLQHPTPTPNLSVPLDSVSLIFQLNISTDTSMRYSNSVMSTLIPLRNRSTTCRLPPPTATLVTSLKSVVMKPLTLTSSNAIHPRRTHYHPNSGCSCLVNWRPSRNITFEMIHLSIPRRLHQQLRP